MTTTDNKSVQGKATEYARKIGENAMLFVAESNNVYWIKLNYADGRTARTLMAVGFVGCGIREVRKSIAEYFQGK